MSQLRRMRRVNIRAEQEKAKENEDKIKALLKYRHAVELGMANAESTKGVIYIGKEEFLYIYEGKLKEKAALVAGLSYYMTMVQIDFKLLDYGARVHDSYIDRQDVPVYGVPDDVLKEAIKNMPIKDMFLTDPIPYDNR